MICNKCNREVSDRSEFCVHCGAMLDKSNKSVIVVPVEEKKPVDDVPTVEDIQTDVEDSLGVESRPKNTNASAAIVFVVVIGCVAILLTCFASLGKKSLEDWKNGRYDEFISDIQSMAGEVLEDSVQEEVTDVEEVIPEVETLPSKDEVILEESAYYIAYSTGWQRTITYRHYDGVIYECEDYWLAPNISAWSESDINYQTQEFDKWVASIRGSKNLSVEYDTSNGQFKTWFIATNLERADDRLSFSSMYVFQMISDGEYCSMDLTEEKLAKEGFVKEK